MKIEGLDHFVLTVRDMDATIRFYKHIGMDLIEFGDNRKALSFGHQKINLHEYGKEFEPKAKTPYPGSGDFCFITDTPIREVISYLESAGIVVEEGPVFRTGATGKIESIYLRDPDENLIEISNYV